MSKSIAMRRKAKQGNEDQGGTSIITFIIMLLVACISIYPLLWVIIQSF